MRYLKTNTATIVTVGPFFDKGDGVTLETSLTITNERISFVVDLNNGSAPTLVLDNVTGATSGTNNDLNYITNCDAALMQLELAAANVNYLGRAFLTITDAANHCPVFHEFTILPAQVYDSLIVGTDLLQADTTQIGGTAQTARDLGASVLLSSGTGTGQLSISSGVVAANATQISGDSAAADNAEAFFDGTGYAGTNNVIPLVTTTTTATNLTNLPAAAATAAELAKVPKSDSNVSWNATALAAINAEVDTALNTAIPGSPTANSVNERIATMDGLLLGTVAAGTHVAQSGDSFARLGAPAGASVSADVAAVKAQTAAIETDTQDLQTQIGTDGAGLTNMPWNAAWDAQVESEVTDALNAYDPPTNAEMVARTLAAASYFDPAADTVANVTTVATTTNLTNLPAAAALEATLTAMKGATFNGTTDSLEALRDRGDAAWATATGFATAANLATLAGYVDTEVAAILAAVDTEVAAIKAKTDNLPTDPADQSAVEAAITAATSPLATAAALATVAGYVDTEVASILAAVDTEVAAIKAKTDNLPASPAATGAAMTLTAAYDAAKTAATQASVDDLPTNAELAAALAGADDAVLAAIADVPTVAEFNARTLLAAEYVVVSDLPAAAPSAAENATAAAAAILVTPANKLATGATGEIAADVTKWAGIATTENQWYVLSRLYWMIDEAFGASYFNDTALLRVKTAIGLAAANLDTQLATLPTAAENADAVWDEAIAGHAIVGSTGAALSAAGGAGDPWSTALPGAYGAGTAGALLSGIDSNVDLLLAADTSTSDATAVGAISRRRGNSWAIPLTIGAITGYTSLWFTIKSSYDDADTAALVQVKLNSPSALDGLLYVNGTTASSAALGSITVSDATTGAIVVNVDETITDDLAPGEYYYDVQTLIAGAVATPDSGVFTVTADVTRSVA